MHILPQSNITTLIGPLSQPSIQAVDACMDPHGQSVRPIPNGNALPLAASTPGTAPQTPSWPISPLSSQGPGSSRSSVPLPQLLWARASSCSREKPTIVALYQDLYTELLNADFTYSNQAPLLLAQHYNIGFSSSSSNIGQWPWKQWSQWTNGRRERWPSV